ncbi:MAG: hypothetical protein JNK49_20855 [Planctomycetes bacterium]|nr:hypothetical protein [Planctomycetota bacterium]
MPAVSSAAVALALSLWWWLVAAPAPPGPSGFDLASDPSGQETAANDAGPQALPPPARVAIQPQSAATDTATLLVLPKSLDTKRRPAAVHITEIAAPNPARKLTVPEDGQLQLPPGTWRVTCPEPEFAFDRDTIDLEAQQTSVLYYAERLALTVQVRSMHGPVAAASVSWRPVANASGAALDLQTSAEGAWSTPASTDARGECRLPGVVHPAWLLVAAAGHEPSLQRLTQPLPHATVLLRVADESQEPTLTCIDATNDHSVVDADVRSICGPLPRTSDAAGNTWFRLPRWPELHAARVVWCTAPRYCRMRLTMDAWNGWPESNQPSEPRRRIPLWPAAPIEFRSSPAFALAPLQIEVLDLETATCGAVGDWPRAITEGLPSPCRLDAVGHQGPILLPVGATVTARALLASGAAATARFRVLPGPQQIDLAPAAADDLVLQVRSPDGQPVPDANADARYALGAGRQWQKLHGNAAGTLRVPLASRLVDLRISAQGRPAIRLQPAEAQPADRRNGNLVVVLPEALSTLWQVHDATGGPIPGVAVHAEGLRQEQRHRFPEGRGAMPTDHPGWWRLDQVSQTGVSDRSGAVMLPLAAGTYLVDLRLPAAMAGGSPNPVESKGRFEVRDAGPYRLLLQRPRGITLLGFDRQSGAPLLGMTYWSSDGLLHPGREQPGHRHEILLADAVRSLTIASHGFQTATVELPPTGGELAVHLDPGGAGSLELVGETNDLAGAELRLHVRMPHDALWTTVLRWTPPQIPLWLPPNEPAEVVLEATEVGPSRWTFAPRQAVWQPGATLRFQATRQSLGR